VLPCTGFRDDPGFAHAFCEQNLADGIVDFMSARMSQILAFEVDAPLADMRGILRAGESGVGRPA